MSEELCPCMSGTKYDECCALFIEKKQLVPSPEALMRSRYTAYVKGKVQYIVDSTHPDHRGSCDEGAIKDWSEKAQWKGLQVIRAQEENGEGKVEFIASYSEKGEQKKHHEISTFKKHEGNWFFDTGKVVMFKVDKVGRNDPCPCGSGKKYKKCCG